MNWFLNLWRNFALAFGFCVVMLPSGAVAQEVRICEDIFQLKSSYEQSRLLKAGARPAADMSALKRLAKQLSKLGDRTANAQTLLIAEKLGALTEKLAPLSAALPNETRSLGSGLHRGLGANLHYLAALQEQLGCETPQRVTQDPSAENKLNPFQKLIEIWVAFRTLITDTLTPFLWIAIALGSAIALRLIMKVADRGRRRVCRTPLQILYPGGKCTMTFILDANLGGFKVEAPKQETTQKWLDLNFCGFQTQGRIVWRNQYYLGIKFKKKISQDMLDRVIENSRAPFAESGLQDKTTPCFSEGCHLNCKRHLATTLALEGVTGEGPK